MVSLQKDIYQESGIQAFLVFHVYPAGCFFVVSFSPDGVSPGEVLYGMEFLRRFAATQSSKDNMHVVHTVVMAEPNQGWCENVRSIMINSNLDKKVFWRFEAIIKPLVFGCYLGEWMFLSHSPARSAILVVVLMPICDAWSNADNTFGITWLSFLLILLMEGILHQLIGSLSHYLQASFTSQVG